MRRLRRAIKRFRDTEGANMVEAAIVAPLLVLLTFTIVDFSGLFYAWLALENGVSQATRFAVTGTVTGTLSRSDSIKAAMRQATPSLTISDSAFTFSHLAVGGSAWVGGTGGPDEVERLTVDYTWTFFTPLMRPFFPSGNIHLRASSTMRNEGKFQ
jgi:Flp pilus assembly protein TadG